MSWKHDCTYNCYFSPTLDSDIPSGTNGTLPPVHTGRTPRQWIALWDSDSDYNLETFLLRIYSYWLTKCYKCMGPNVRHFHHGRTTYEAARGGADVASRGRAPNVVVFFVFVFKKGYFSRHFSSVFLTRYREINKMKVLPVGKYPNHHKLATWKVICIMWLHGSQLLDVDIHLENYKFVIFQCDWENNQSSNRYDNSDNC